MKRTLVLVALIILSVGLLYAGGEKESPSTGTEDRTEETMSEEPKEVVELKWANSLPADQFDSKYFDSIAKRVLEETDGIVEITVHHGGTLGPEMEMYQLLRAGSVAFLNSAIAGMARFYEPINVLALPFVFNDYDHYKRFEADPYIQELYTSIIPEQTGIRLIAPMVNGRRCLTTNSVQPNVPSDMKGVKIRSMSSEAAQFMVRTLGATPVPLDVSDLYMAMQTGMVDGQENPPNVIIMYSFYEVQNNLVLTFHAFNIGAIYMSEKAWNQIPSKYQPIVKKIFEEEMDEFALGVLEREAKDIQKLKEEYGMNIVEP
ncbi:hypothetical protein GF340_01410, partial [Candidatus Peregrinibacteria bacterium]|nr:hypothetical protein [Candidatus Peregrinibacteria bacterium]